MFFRHNLSFHLIPIIIFLFCINPAHSAEIILDNNQAGTVATGAWQLSSGVNSYGTQSVYSREVGATYRYTIPISEPGTYDVNLWWTEFHNRSTNVAVDITHRDGTARIYINQKQNGGQWNQVGSWYFTEDAIITIHSDSTNNSTNADAVRLISVDTGGNGNSAPTIGGLPATTVTVDTAYRFFPTYIDADGDDLTFNISNKPSWAIFNADTGSLAGTPTMSDEGTTQNIVISVSDGLLTTSLLAFNLTVVQDDSGTVVELTLDNNQPGTVATGNWLPSGGANSYGTQSLYSRDVGATYRYTLHIDEAGTYDVNLWWTEFRSRSTNVAVDITHSDGTARVYVNQKQNGGQWNKVGSWYFTEDAIITIHSDSTNNSTNADAVRLISAVNQTPDTQAPTAAIHFPAAGSALTQVDSVLVTGTASDASMITRVKVAGVDATTTNGYANWRAVVPLQPGDNTLLIETTDEFSNIDSAAAMLIVEFNGPILIRPKKIVLDVANNRTLVVDNGLRAVVAVDLTSGARTFLSDGTTPDAVNPFNSPLGIELDTANNRALVTDSGLDALVAVDLTSGARTMLSDDTTPDTVNPFSSPLDIVLDTANGRALVLDSRFAGIDYLEMDADDLYFTAVVAVDLASGARTFLYNEETPDAYGSYSYPVAIALDTVNNRALVVKDSDSNFGSSFVIAIDLTSGTHTFLSTWQTPPGKVNLFSSPRGIALDTANDRALVIDSGLDAVVAVDLASGARTLLSDETMPDAANPFSTPLDIVLDTANDRALVMDYGLNTVVAVNLESGTRTIIPDITTPDTANPLIYPRDLVLDTANNRVLVVDSGLDALVAVDLTIGVRTILSDNTTPDANYSLFYPRSLVLDTANDRVLLLDRGNIVAVDLASGVRTIFSDSLHFPTSLVLDASNGRVLVVDNNLDAVVAVDLTSGMRTILSDDTTPNATNPFDFPMDIVLDTANNRALILNIHIADFAYDEEGKLLFFSTIVAVDLASGARTILSKSTMSNAVISLSSITLDPANNRALVFDIDDAVVAVVAVDLTSGVRTILSSRMTPNAANPLSSPQAIVVDEANGRALVVDSGSGAIVAVELNTGERVIISK